MTLLDDSHPTDPGLVADVRMGRREAFGELYRRYYQGALRYALSITRGDETRAQDIVSEAFTGVFRAMSRNGNVSAFWPYLLASVRNAHRAELRRSGRVDLVERAADLDALLPEAPSESGPDDPSIRAAFHRLPARWQSVLWRSEICGDTAAEIGHDLGISANAAAALAFRAREGLRVEYLQDHLTTARAECRPYAEQLAKLVRGVLGRRDRRRVEAHVRICDECGRALADLTALNGRMRSVLPLILGVLPFASGQGGFTSAPAGAVGSGVVGSATVVSGAAGTAGVVGGATGVAGVAGVGGVGALGMTHVGAVAGLAVASMVAVFGLPVERSPGEPGEVQPAQTVVAPDDAAVAQEPADAPVETFVDGSAPAPGTDTTADDGASADGSTMNAQSSTPAFGGESTVSGGLHESASPEQTSEPLVGLIVPDGDSAGDGTDGPASGDGTASQSGRHGQSGEHGRPDNGSDSGVGSPNGQPVGNGVPATPNGQAANHWPWSNEDGTGPGRSGVGHGKNDSGGSANTDAPDYGEPANDGFADGAPAHGSGKPEQATGPSPAQPALPPQAGGSTRPGPAQPARPSQADGSAQRGPGQPLEPPQAVESTTSDEGEPDESTKPAEPASGAAKASPPGKRGNDRGASPSRGGWFRDNVTHVTSNARHTRAGWRISSVQASTRRR